MAFLVQPVNAERPRGRRQLGEAEHRRLPDGQVAERLTDCGSRIEGEVAHPVPIWVVQPAQPLIGMHVQRVARLVGSSRRRIVREDPVDEHYAYAPAASARAAATTSALPRARSTSMGRAPSR